MESKRAITPARQRAATTSGILFMTILMLQATLVCAAEVESDFSWLRAYHDTGSVQADIRYGSLIKATTPPYLSDFGDVQGSKLLSTQLDHSLGGAPEPITHFGNRYIVLSGCQPHNCPVTGLLWVDLEKRISIGAMKLCTIPILDKSRSIPTAKLLVFSKAVSSNEVPKEFMEELSAWNELDRCSPTNVTFVNGDTETSVFPSNWIDCLISDPSCKTPK